MKPVVLREFVKLILSVEQGYQRRPDDDDDKTRLLYFPLPLSYSHFSVFGKYLLRVSISKEAAQVKTFHRQQKRLVFVTISCSKVLSDIGGGGGGVRLHFNVF